MFSYLLKLILLLLLFTNINADDFDDEDVILGVIATEKKTNEEAVELVYNSAEKNFTKYNLSLSNDNLTLDKKGNIIMFIPTNRMNIDFENILKSLKFTTSMDQNSVFKCEFVGSTNKYCDHIFFTAAAADTLGDSSALLNMTKSFLSGNIGVEKKFDKIEFAKYILDNEAFIKKTVEKIILLSVPPHNKEKTNSVVSVITAIPSSVNFSKNNQANKTSEFKKHHCTTQWIQVYNQKYPPPRVIKEIEIDLAVSKNELIVISDKSEHYNYSNELRLNGVFGLHFKSKSGRSVELYENGNLYILEDNIETLKARCLDLPIKFKK